MSYGLIFENRQQFVGKTSDACGSSDLPAVTWVTKSRSRSGTVTSNYRRIVAKNQKLPQNDYSAWGFDCNVKPYRTISDPYYAFCGGGDPILTQRRYIQYPKQTGYCVTNVSHDAGVLQSSIRDCQNKAADGSANFALMFAERKQVYSLVMNTAKRLANVRKTLADYAFKRVRHEYAVRTIEAQLSFGSRKFRVTDIRDQNRFRRNTSWYRPAFDHRRLSGNLASDWLAVQYGVVPLLHDVVDAAEHFAQRALDAEKDPSKPMLVRFVGRASKTVNFVGGVGNGIRGSTKHQARTTLNFKVNVSYLRQAQQTGILNLASLGWELIPYSFVVDWFADVGDYLNRISYTAGLTFVDGFHSRKSEITYTGSFTDTTHGLLQAASVSGSVFKVTRTPIQTPPATIGVGWVGDGLGLTRSLNAIALLRQQMPSSPDEWRNSRVRKLR